MSLRKTGLLALSAFAINMAVTGDARATSSAQAHRSGAEQPDLNAYRDPNAPTRSDARRAENTAIKKQPAGETQPNLNGPNAPYVPPYSDEELIADHESEPEPPPSRTNEGQTRADSRESSSGQNRTESHGHSSGGKTSTNTQSRSSGRSRADTQSRRGKGSTDSRGRSRSASNENVAWTTRDMTPARHELQILAGPTSVQSLTIMPREFGLSHQFYFEDRETNDPPYASVDTHLSHGVVFAPLENLEVGLAFPVAAPGGLRHIPVWLTYRFLDGPVQLGFRHAIYIPADGDERATFQFALPLLYRNGRVRLETAAAFNVTSTRNATMQFSVPLRVGFQVAPRWYAGFQTGFSVTGQTEEDVEFTMPLYGFFGHTIPTRGLPVDISLRLGFDRLLGSANDPSEHVASMRHFSVAAGVNFGFQLGR